MTKDEARVVLIAAFSTPDLPDDMKEMLAKLIVPPKPKRKRFVIF